MLFNELPIYHLLINKTELTNLASMEDQPQEYSHVEKLVSHEQDQNSMCKANLSNEKIKGIFYKIISAKGLLVGHLLGTVHFASRDMLEFNFTIRDAIKRSNQIYLEINDDISTTHEEKNNIEELEEPLSPEENEKLQVYVNTAFKVIINQLHAYGASIDFIATQANQFIHSSPQIKLELIDKLINQLGIISAETALIKDPSNPYIKYQLGMEAIIILHTMNYDKKLCGLENNSEAREKLINKFEKPSLKKRIDRLPNASEITEEFILQALSVLKKQINFGMTVMTPILFRVGTMSILN